MKKLIVLSLIMASCSSAPKNQSSDLGDSSNGGSGDTIDIGGDDSPQTSPQKNLPPDPNVNHDQLKGAIETNNARKVEEVASGLLARNPKDVRALNALGVQQLKSNKPTLARMIFKKSMEIDPRNAGTVNNYALTFMAEKEELRAMQEFKKALEIDSKNAAAAGNLGALHIKAKNYPEARRWLEVAYSKNKSNSKIANNFAVALRGTGDFAASRRVYEGIAPDSKDSSLLLNYAILLVENLNDKTKGQEVINKIKFLASDPAILERAKQLEAKIK